MHGATLRTLPCPLPCPQPPGRLPRVDGVRGAVAGPPRRVRYLRGSRERGAIWPQPGPVAWRGDGALEVTRLGTALRWSLRSPGLGRGRTWLFLLGKCHWLHF